MERWASALLQRWTGCSMSKQAKRDAACKEATNRSKLTRNCLETETRLLDTGSKLARNSSETAETETSLLEAGAKLTRTCLETTETETPLLETGSTLTRN